MQSMKSNKTLLNLDLGKNNITREGSKWISEYIRANNTIKNISIEDCSLE